MGNVKIIGASAGSGKTYRLAYEYVRKVVDNPTLYRNILAVTFTNKATEEMKSRILERIHELANGDPSPYLGDLMKDLGLDEKTVRKRALEARKLILHDYSRFAVLTIDRFFQRMIRSFIRELGVEVNFNLELETDSLLAVAADTLIEDIASDEDLRQQLFMAARERVEGNKRWSVKEPLLGLGKQLFKEEYQRVRDAGIDKAEAGSIIEKIVAKAENVKAEMRGAATEFMGILVANDLQATDFKGLSRSLVPYVTKVAAGVFGPLSSAAKDALGSDENWPHKGSGNKGLVESLIPQLRPLLQQINDLYEGNLRLMRSADLLKENHRNFMLLGDLQQRVEQICADENIMPISETNRMISQLVSGNDTPFIFEKAGNYYSFFMIDEFQDTSSSQWDNFVPLLRNAISQEKGNPVLLIGDVKQAIYRWRGGDWQILSHRVREEMGEGRVDSETLETNFRSMRRVVGFNNAIVGLVTEADNEELNVMVGKALAAGAIGAEEAVAMTDLLADAYRGHAQKTKEDAGEGYVTITLYEPDGEGESVPPVITKIEELQIRGYAPGDIAVLVRSNDHGTRVAQMLLAHKHENPDSPYGYDVITQDALTVGSAAVSRFIIACLSLAVDQDDSIQRAVYNRWLEREFAAELNDDERDFFLRAASLSPEEAFEEIVMRYGLQDRNQEIAYIQAVHEQINNYSAKKVADIALFLKWWSEKGCDASIAMQGGANAITVSTIHKSKGLQYKAVVIPYLTWGMNPESGIVWAGSSGTDMDGLGTMPVKYRKEMADSFFAPKYYEERVMSHIDAVNMFYVAVTRAEEELHLMMPEKMPADSIGSLVRRVLCQEEAAVIVGKERGVVSRPDDMTTLIEFGRPEVKPEAKPAAGRGMTSYPTSRPGARVRLRLPSARYFEQGDAELSPRDFGILMHQAFEKANGADDVNRAVDRMLKDSRISAAEHTQLSGLIGKAFANPLVSAWFGDGWGRVRNENDIVVPGNVGVKRPDRVMISGDRAVVVDYKFGRRISDDYADQLREYMSLIRAMGYGDVTGYIWYVSLDRIEEVK